MAALEVVRIAALTDNYVWLVHDAASGETLVIDPAEAAPVLAEADRRGWRIGQVWNTHWHPDHTGGNAGVREAHGATVIAPAAEAAKIPTADRLASEGDVLTLGEHRAHVIATPAHTAGHVSFHFADDAAVFVGDTLFAMGCGRLFEGSAKDMFDSLAKLAVLPDDTLVYCGHEYTLSNARYAAAAEPANAAITERLKQVEAMHAAGEATVPTTIALEKATNPFVRARSADELAERRAAKDAFRG